ncbi:hypothetical protein Y032_0521g2867 [Ancylostoma ceylanicum]|uniref:DDE Tnp4 domain-containing protein n=1 Tax=Ancylostoma ceylanicum TaxID=53326 RepID=A0A016WTW2_9BILA|nr:hypothetical protein Y032_0521g2867 [Ancylostoma ceylanicum]
MRADIERSTNRAIPLTTAQQLAITIRVLASRSFQLNAGDSFGVAQSMVSRVVASVSDWFHQNSERKDFASINMGAIVDDNYRFLWFSARWPGRAHDSRVWRESQLYVLFMPEVKNNL